MDRLLRITQIIPDILPISKSNFYAGIKEGKFPPPVKLGPRTSTWRESEIRQIVENGIPLDETESPGIKTGACQGHGGCKNAKK